MTMNPDQLSRRGFGGRMAALAALGLTTPAGMAAAAPAMPDLADPEVNVRLFAKMLGDLSGAPVIYYYKADVFAWEPGGQIVPLMGFDGFSHSRYFLQDDGSVRIALKDLTFYVDLETREPLDRFENTLNGQMVEPRHHHQDPGSFILTANGPVVAGQELRSEMDDTPFVLPWTLIGDEAWVDFRYLMSHDNPLDPAENPLRYTGPVIHSAELTTYKGPRDQVVDDDVPRVDSWAAWQSIKPWEPWMLMGDRPGAMYTRANALKLARLDQLPETLLAATRARYPGNPEPPETWEGRTVFRPSYFGDQQDMPEVE